MTASLYFFILSRVLAFLALIISVSMPHMMLVSRISREQSFDFALRSASVSLMIALSNSDNVDGAVFGRCRIGCPFRSMMLRSLSRNFFDIRLRFFLDSVLILISSLFRSDCHNVIASLFCSNSHKRLANFSLISREERPAAMQFLRILADTFKDLDSSKFATSARIGSSSSCRHVGVACGRNLASFPDKCITVFKLEISALILFG